MNEVEIFTHEEFGEIRTVTDSADNVWFCGNDVAKALGYERGAKAISDHVDLEDRHEVPIRDSIGRMQNTAFINESGLYSLVLSSKLHSAKKFKRWVTSEVLPSIRKNGIYATENTIDKILDNPDFGIELLTKLKQEREEKKALQEQNVVLNKENALLAQQNLEWADRPMINAIVRAYAISVDGGFREAWVDFKKELLYQHGINLNARITNHMNNTGKKTKPKTLDMLDDTELPKALSVAVSMCKHNDVDISEIISKKSKLKGEMIYE